MNKKLEMLTTEKKDEHPYQEDLSKLSAADKKRMIHAGIDLDSGDKSGTFLMKDQSIVHCNIAQDSVELLSMEDASRKYDNLDDYWWKLVAPDKDQYTKKVKENDGQGYFIRAKEGQKSIFPVQTCLYLEHSGTVQTVHNVIIAEAGSEVDIITGCTSKEKSNQTSAHLGVSEIYVKKGAKVTYSMIHNWDEDVKVRPRTGVRIEEGGQFISNYISMKAVKDVQMNPAAHHVGKDASSSFNSILVAPQGAHLDIGAQVFLEAENTSTEIVSKALTTGGEIISRGLISGQGLKARGHLECQGLVLSDKGRIYTVPELDGRLSDIDLSHEAAVGKVAQDEIEYLMARGLTEDQAISLIVKGFLSAEIKGLPEILEKEIDDNVKKIEKDAF
ncbi:MAG: SufD family Fe-S cluster assembly protein [Candidatus Marinimicrobia bacterium]|nr:SufD family Fe-S cluster assembly protein [Candidatus Neomarinimicrobiota bacterium]